MNKSFISFLLIFSIALFLVFGFSFYLYQNHEDSNLPYYKETIEIRIIFSKINSFNVLLPVVGYNFNSSFELTNSTLSVLEYQSGDNYSLELSTQNVSIENELFGNMTFLSITGQAKIVSITGEYLFHPETEIGGEKYLFITQISGKENKSRISTAMFYDFYGESGTLSYFYKADSNFCSIYYSNTEDDVGHYIVNNRYRDENLESFDLSRDILCQ